MIEFDPESKTLKMDLVNLEHCGFDHDAFEAELHLSGIKDPGALWPEKLEVQIRGGAVKAGDCLQRTGMRLGDYWWEDVLRTVDAVIGGASFQDIRDRIPPGHKRAYFEIIYAFEYMAHFIPINIMYSEFNGYAGEILVHGSMGHLAISIHSEKRDSPVNMIASSVLMA